MSNIMERKLFSTATNKYMFKVAGVFPIKTREISLH